MPPRHCHCIALLANLLPALAVSSGAFVTTAATPGRRAASSADAPRFVSAMAVYGASPPEGDGDDANDVVQPAQPSLEDGAYGPFGETAMIVALGSITLLMGAALFNLATDPRSELDVDLYLSITRSLSGLGGASADLGMGSGGNGGLEGIAVENLELPFLGPSEQIVSAFFGAPQETEMR